MAKIDPLRLQNQHHRSIIVLSLLLALSVVWSGAVVGQCACGIRQSANQSVVPGEQIEPGEWPWQVGIYWWPGSKLNPPKRICEGALLNPDGWVLTAANCLKGADGSLLGIEGMVGHVGLVALQQSTEGSRRFAVENVRMNDELDLALVKLDVGEEWDGMSICLNDGIEDWDNLYGNSVYVLQQSHRHRLGGFEIVRLELEKEVMCYGSTLAVKAKAISDNSIKLKTRGTNYRETARGTPLYVYKPEGWSLLGISNKIRSSIPDTFCQPGDYESFLNTNQNEVYQWIYSSLDEDINSSVETSTE
ncbi:serine protease 28-like [Toxorhynchites rutilus septentrionalis]|uniref:serine protease 28-like n=1 Tax=Toxorhynchites rutilus septentrionalis TaxID=329112 RepID=UPI002478FBD1|nr:serine protease 28-like [Toxorhynchites rutilus septentrionalis]